MNRSRLGALGLSVLCLGLSAAQLRADPAPTPSKPRPEAAAVKALDADALAARIDRYLDAKLAEVRVKPAPLADDAEFLRRVYLDLTGRTPRVADARAFLEDRSPDRRQRLVEKLLESPQHVAHMANTWTATILPSGNNRFQNFALTFKPWVEQQVRANVPYDKMVRELLTVPFNNGPLPRGVVPQGGRPTRGPTPVAFYQANENKPENLAAATTRVFLGVRLECAQCHNHPFAGWKRDQFWGVAAFFTDIRPQFVRGRVQQPPPAPNARTIMIPGTEKVVPARFLDNAPTKFQPDVSSRVTLADWVTSPENPYFARTGANRIWAHLFGLGVNDPVDDEPTDENPISHPELLQELTQQFVAHEFDVKYLIRAITLSKAYQRTSATKAGAKEKDEPRLFARMALKGMTPEQLFDSLAQATGYREAAVDPRIRVRGPQGARAQFLLKFASQDKRTETHTSILQALALMNGKFISDATSLERSTTLSAVVDAPFLSTEKRVEALYLAALTRPPSPEELSRMVAYVEGGGPRRDSSAALGDVFWVLLNSSEFLFNH
jgi:hypothetical protein